ncbi:MAG: ROK family protein [Motilibacteraceae bacterium]
MRGATYPRVRPDDELPAALRSGNRVRVLETVAHRGRVTRAEIARATGLASTTVSALVGELLAEDLLAERPAPRGPRGRGRPATLLTLNPHGGTVLGIHLRHDGVRVAVADLAGTVLAQRGRRLDVDHRVPDALAAVTEMAQRLTEGRRRTVGAGVAVSTPVLPLAAESSVLPLLGARPGVDVAALLGRALGVPVHVANDADLGALAEWAYGVARGLDDVVYVMLGDGVGAGLVLGGRLHRGARGVAGELGHVAVVSDGRLCRCGATGCLETVAALPALLRDGWTSLVELVAALDVGDVDAVELARAAGEAVGRALAGVVPVLAPQAVVVGGPGARLGEPLLAGVRATLYARTSPAAPEVPVLPGALGVDAELRGAVAEAIRRTWTRLLP